MAETTVRKRRGPGKPFKPGQSGNPKGRPKGSRHRLSEAFVAALCEDFETHGAKVIRHVREKDPSTYVRVAASLLPKEFKIEQTSDLTDEQLDARIRGLIDALGLEAGIGGAFGRAPEAGKPSDAQSVQTIQ